MVIQCNKNNIYLAEAETLTSASKNVFELSFVFDEAWDGLSKTIIFLSGETAISVVLDPSERCMIPHEALRVPQAVYVGVYGSDPERVLTTPWCLLGVVQSGAEGGEPYPEPTPTVYEQILELERLAIESVEALRAEAESGAFDGEDGMTPSIGENGNWYLGDTDTGHSARGERGYSGLCPRASVPYASLVTVAANVVTDLSPTRGPLEIKLGEGHVGYDNEWIFIIRQGETVFDIVLPVVAWSLGVAPTFGVSSVTEVRLHYKGDALEGVWS